MNESKVRAILSIIIVSCVMIVTGIMAVYIYANDLQDIADSSKTLDHVQNYLSLFTGIIGLILGYYFGRESKA